MHITTLMMLCLFFMVACFGGILAMDNALTMPSQTTQTDTFGNSVTSTTNGTQALVVSTTAYEERGMSLGALMLAAFVIITIVLTFMFLYRKNSPNHGRYRT
jgi:hypothetical protein